NSPSFNPGGDLFHVNQLPKKDPPPKKDEGKSIELTQPTAQPSDDKSDLIFKQPFQYRAPPAFMPQMNMNMTNNNNFDVQSEAAMQQVLNDVRKSLLGMIDTAANETRMLASRIVGAN